MESEKSIPITLVFGESSANHFALYPNPQPASRIKSFELKKSLSLTSLSKPYRSRYHFF